jgi:hypothetical protein
MTTLNPEKPAPPTSEELAALLGSAIGLWSGLHEAVRAANAPVTERWVYGGRKYGWSCRLEQGKKGVLYMTPDAGHFRIGMALSDSDREAVLASEVPIDVREALAATTKAMEGWPVRMAVRTADDVAVVLELVEIKLSVPQGRPDTRRPER